jgi:MoaA/NifB/PqqE/SkfB family radical SAM enzyme
MSSWSILYRGPLSSCNYSCTYCPFAKTKNTKAELADDAARLQRFVDWVATRQEQIGILFTPWGEGLIRKAYQKAMTRLSHLPHVRRVSIQTNLSGSLNWMAQVNRARFALWTTFHPSQITLDKFVARCWQLEALGIRYSVGLVALKEDLSYLEALRAHLPAHRYVWANAYKRVEQYYTPAEIAQIERVDPLFSYNNQYHPSLNQSCQAGQTAFTVDGAGDVRRCHFIDDVLGNIYTQDIAQVLRPRLCSNATCGCYIGYVHLDRLKLYERYKTGILERIPPPFR